MSKLSGQLQKDHNRMQQTRLLYTLDDLCSDRCMLMTPKLPIVFQNGASQQLFTHQKQRSFLTIKEDYPG